MGQVIAFRPRADRASPEPMRPDGGAQILFFLGVRYMRMDDEHGGDAPQDAKGARKRRRRAKAS